MTDYNVCNVSIVSVGIPFQMQKKMKSLVAASDLQVPMSLQQSHMPVLQELGPLALVTTDTTWTGCCWTGTCMNCCCWPGTCMNCCWAMVSEAQHNNTQTSSINQSINFCLHSTKSRRKLSLSALYNQKKTNGTLQSSRGQERSGTTVGRNLEQLWTQEGTHMIWLPFWECDKKLKLMTWHTMCNLYNWDRPYLLSWAAHTCTRRSIVRKSNKCGSKLVVNIRLERYRRRVLLASLWEEVLCIKRESAH